MKPPKIGVRCDLSLLPEPDRHTVPTVELQNYDTT
jgi:hypothetical protein